MLRHRVVWIGLAGVALVLALVSTADASKPKSPVGPAVERKDATDPQERHTYMVWRNGKFHEVKVKVKRTVETDKAGMQRGIIEEDGASIADQLPPVDPAFDDVKPTPQQEAESKARLGIKGPDAPPGLSQRAIPAEEGP